MGRCSRPLLDKKAAGWYGSFAFLLFVRDTGCKFRDFGCVACCCVVKYRCDFPLKPSVKSGNIELGTYYSYLPYITFILHA